MYVCSGGTHDGVEIIMDSYTYAPFLRYINIFYQSKFISYNISLMFINTLGCPLRGHPSRWRVFCV